MRVLLLWCLLTGACMLAGWPGHWMLAAVSFLAGMVAVWRPAPASAASRRGGYVHEPTRNHRTLTERVYDYGGADADDAAELRRDLAPTTETGS